MEILSSANFPLIMMMTSKDSFLLRTNFSFVHLHAMSVKRQKAKGKVIPVARRGDP
jgi:hypothetical protein